MLFVKFLSEYMKVKAKRRVSCEQLAHGLAHMEGLTRAQSVRVVKTVFQHILLHLSEGAVVDIPGILKLETIYTQPRQGSHPKTHDPIEVKEGIRLRAQLSVRAKEVLLGRIEVFREKYLEKKGQLPNDSGTEAITTAITTAAGIAEE